LKGVAQAQDLSGGAVALRNANGTLALLTVIYVFNFIDRQILNILAESIAKELSLSDTQIGLMTGFAFAVFYTFMGIPLARYADRPDSDRITLMSICLAVWSAMTAACGLAQNFGQLLLARIGVGAGIGLLIRGECECRSRRERPCSAIGAAERDELER
jgi:MFS family permease